MPLKVNTEAERGYWQPGDSRIEDLELFAREQLDMSTTPEMVLSNSKKNRQYRRATALTRQQVDTILSVRGNRRTVVRGAHSLGKSVAIGVLGCWWLTRKRDNMVLMASAKEDQVSKVLFPNMLGHYVRAFGRRGKVGALQVYPDPLAHPKWCAIGISGQNTEAFASYHPHGDGEVLLIIDEGSAMTQALGQAAEGLISSEAARIVVLGNPLNTKPRDPFRALFSDKQYNKIHWITSEHPNIEHQKPIYPGCISQTWIDEMIDRYGIEDDEVQARCFGEFPPIQSLHEKNKIYDANAVAEISGLSLEELYAEEMREEEKEEENLFQFVGQGHTYSQGIRNVRTVQEDAAKGPRSGQSDTSMGSRSCTLAR